MNTSSCMTTSSVKEHQITTRKREKFILIFGNVSQKCVNLCVKCTHFQYVPIAFSESPYGSPDQFIYKSEYLTSCFIYRYFAVSKTALRRPFVFPNGFRKSHILSRRWYTYPPNKRTTLKRFPRNGEVKNQNLQPINNSFPRKIASLLQFMFLVDVFILDGEWQWTQVGLFVL